MTLALRYGASAPGRRRGRLTGLALALAGQATLAQGPQPLPSPLRLEQVVRLARENRSEIAAARAGAQARAQRPAIVSALEDPMISPSIDHLPFMLHGADVSLAIEQRFPLSRIRGSRARGAEAEAERARAEVARAELDVELDAARAFLMLQERREMARIVEERRALAQQLVRAATARYAAGTGPQADALRAEIEVARLEGDVRALAAEARAAEVMLNTSLGRSGRAPVPTLDGSVPAGTPPSPEAAMEAALSSRPELRAGRAEVGRAVAEVSAMESMYWPMAMVRTGPAYTMTDGPGWMVMVGLSVPLWRGKLDAGVAEAEAMVSMAQAELAAMRLMVEGEALSAREQVVGARERYLSLRDHVVPRAEQSIEPALGGYGSGQLPLVSVLDSAQALWSAQGELVSAEYELGLAWARLRRAMGGGGQR